MSIVQHSQQALLLPPGISLPREQLATIQHILHQALRSAAPPPPPPYNPRGAAGQWYRPRMDMYEASGSVTAKFELPGLRKEDIHIDVVDNNMIIVGERHSHPAGGAKEEEEPGTGRCENSSSPEEMHVEQSAPGYTVREIKHGKFRRVVPLPAGTKLEDVKASMHDGILTVTFPGAPRPVVRSIPIA